MSTMRTRWISARADPVFMRRLNGWLTIFWIAMIPVSLATGWVRSVVYVSALSLWALVSGHWSAWQAARVEVRGEDAAGVGVGFGKRGGLRANWGAKRQKPPIGLASRAS